MSIFGRIKNRVLGKSEDMGEIGDIRSHVIGEDSNVDPYGDDDPKMMNKIEAAPELPETARFGREPIGFEPSPMPEREPMSIESPERNKDYDIMDKLTMIEAQLSAIRSQTETINERLKNLEMRIGRRY